MSGTVILHLTLRSGTGTAIYFPPPGSHHSFLASRFPLFHAATNLGIFRTSWRPTREDWCAGQAVSSNLGVPFPQTEQIPGTRDPINNPHNPQSSPGSPPNILFFKTAFDPGSCRTLVAYYVFPSRMAVQVTIGQNHFS
jgi:hypothetical protein